MNSRSAFSRKIIGPGLALGVMAAVFAACATDKEKKPEPKPIINAVAGMPVSYEASVQPFLEQYCYECHGAKEQKHEIRLDSREAVFARPGLITAGNFRTSALARVLNEPLSSEEHMPPKDHKQPTADQISMIRQWITQGANWPATPPTPAGG